MQRFFESKFAFLTVCALFALALLWNLGHGSTGLPDHPYALPAPESITTAHGATAPPDPWAETKLAHGATAPPDPWAETRG